jgi:hypothetical protein
MFYLASHSVLQYKPREDLWVLGYKTRSHPAKIYKYFQQEENTFQAYVRVVYSTVLIQSLFKFHVQ